MELVKTITFSFTINNVESNSDKKVTKKMLKQAKPIIQLFMSKVEGKYKKITTSYHIEKLDRKANICEAFVLFNLWR